MRRPTRGLGRGREAVYWNCATQCKKAAQNKMNDAHSNVNSTSGRLRKGNTRLNICLTLA